MDSFRRGPPPSLGELIEENRRLREEAMRLCAEARQKIEHLEWVVDSIRREHWPDYFRPLQDAIRARHGCESRHVASFAMRKVSGGQVLWLGIVEEFALLGADGAGACYAWPYTEEGQPQTFTLIKQPLVDSPQAAVQFFLTAKSAPPATKILT